MGQYTCIIAQPQQEFNQEQISYMQEITEQLQQEFSHTPQQMDILNTDPDGTMSIDLMNPESTLILFGDSGVLGEIFGQTNAYSIHIFALSEHIQMIRTKLTALLCNKNLLSLIQIADYEVQQAIGYIPTSPTRH